MGELPTSLAGQLNKNIGTAIDTLKVNEQECLYIPIIVNHDCKIFSLMICAFPFFR
ncbi:MAG: hypothetical protein WKF36_08595 [Candidatus Nitrosocosmicus sp.]